MGSSKRPEPKSNRARTVLRRSKAAGAAARVHQENPSNPGRRSRTRPRAPAGGGELTAGAHPHVGSAFDEFLEQEGLYEEVTADAVKTVIAWQIRQAMDAQGVSKSDMAARLRTSRAQLDRLLDPSNDKVQLDTLKRAAAALGRKIKLELA